MEALPNGNFVPLAGGIRENASEVLDPVRNK